MFSTGSSKTHNDDDDIMTSHRIFSTFFYLLPPSPSGTLDVSCVQSQLGAATVLSPAYRSSSVLRLFLTRDRYMFAAILSPQPLTSAQLVQVYGTAGGE